MDKILKWGLIALGTGVVGFVGYFLFVVYALSSVFDTTHTKADLINNYKSKSREIVALSTYINNLVPAGHQVDIEFDGQETIPIFHVQTGEVYSSNWGVGWNSGRADTLLQQLGWPRQTLLALQEKLDAAGCISIASGDPCKVGYQRSGMSKYSYNVFARPMSDSLKEAYNNGCRYIYYNNRVALEYGGGAMGPDCFEQTQ